MRQEPHAGAPVVHGSEQQSSTANSDHPQPFNPMALRPWAGPEEQHLRKRLHSAMTFSATRARGAKCEWSWSCFQLINEVANYYAVANVPNSELKAVADALVRVAIAADALERTTGCSK